MPHPSQKIAMVTGASRGLGFHLALHYAKNNFHVIALAKTQGGLMELDDSIKKETGKNATLIPFNLSAPDSSYAMLGQTLFARFGKLDRLVLNAAILAASAPVAHTSDKDWQQVLDVNVIANTRLLRHLDPLLRAASLPHITFVSCASLGNAYWGSYRASKLALEQIAASYKEETQQAGFKVDIFIPPPMATQLRRNAYPGEDQTNLKNAAQVAQDYVAQRT